MAPRELALPGTRTTRRLTTVANQSLAHPAPASTTELNALASRALRGLHLYEEYGGEILPLSPDIFLVPSQDGKKMYRVQYGEHEYCSCPDHNYRGVNCVHIYALGIAIAKGAFAHPEVQAGDPFAHVGGRKGCPACYDGVVYLGELVEDPETGEEVEVLEAVRCRRCSESR